MSKAPLHQPLAHDSAALYVTGAAPFVDDRAMPEGCLSIALGLSPCAHGTIKTLDLSKVEASAGVVRVLTVADVDGVNDASPIMGDDPIFAEEIVHYHGQVLFAVVAHTAKQARVAVQKAQVDIAPLPAILTIDEALAQDQLLAPPKVIETGDVHKALKTAPHRLSGVMSIGGQEHFYLEGQAALAIPGEDRDVTLYCSTQHPSEIQHKAAECLGLASHAVTVETRRMGGAFGGKESQGNLCLLYTSPSPRDLSTSRMPSSA